MKLIFRRRWQLVLASSAAALALLLGGAGPAAAATKAPTTLGIYLSQSTVAPNKSTTVVGALRSYGAPVRGQTVQLEMRPAGQSTWTLKSKAQTNSEGKVAFNTGVPVRNTSFRIVYTGAGSLAGSTSLVKLLTVNQTITIGSFGANVQAGQKTWVSGWTTPGLRNKTLSVQIQRDGSWMDNSATIAVGADGRFSGRFALNEGGAQNIRLRFSGDSSAPATVSGAKTVTVYKWYYLNDLEWVDVDDSHTSTWTSIGGTSFQRVIKTGGSTSWGGYAGWAEYNLSYKCTSFLGYVGILDSAASGSTSNFFVSVDGLDRANGTASLGQAQRLELDVSGGFRIRLGITSNGQSTGWGNAKVLCSNQP
ncbi:NPCBM/NEW2 domain-containing protein [Microbacterium sp.]|uniref:NPCBM/NEW2 domain-containing protein n=1 Tax=Microbacterium sp. TaxID=51671 RepID=UPI0039E405BD